jgi:hypothetical protein
VIVQEGVELSEEAAFLRGAAEELRDVRIFESLESSSLKAVKPAVSSERKKMLLEIEELAQRRIELNTVWKKEGALLRGSAVDSLGHIVGIATGSEAFDLTRRSLISLSGKESQYPNLWKWKYQRDGMSAGTAQSVYSVGIPLWAGHGFGDLFFRKDFKPSWVAAGIVGTGSYLLFRWMNSPSYKRNDMCWDSHAEKDICQ